MNDESFNISLRKFLKMVGVSAQREVEEAYEGLLAHRFARQLLVSAGQSWLPEPVPERESTIPHQGAACRRCGCTEAFACPGRCAWSEPGLCTECAVSEELVTWVVYDRPTDHPDKAIARKFIGGVPTPEFIAADSVDALRQSMPAGAHVIPRSAGDPKSVVEVWV